MLTIKHSVRPSSIAGLGIFADETIPAGSLVWKNHTDSELILDIAIFETMSDYMKNNFKHYGYLDIETNQWKLPLDNSRFMNHSDHANLSQDEDGNSIANKTIEKNEEITCDYRSFVNINFYTFL